jgi:cell division protein FtsL
VRPQAALMLALLAFFLILFGVALLQTVLVQGQLHLDGLRADVAERQTEAQEQRAAVAEAESPAALIAAAEEQGFIPVDPIWVLPSAEASSTVP